MTANILDRIARVLEQRHCQLLLFLSEFYRATTEPTTSARSVQTSNRAFLKPTTFVLGQERKKSKDQCAISRRLIS